MLLKLCINILDILTTSNKKDSKLESYKSQSYIFLIKTISVRRCTKMILFFEDVACHASQMVRQSQQELLNKLSTSDFHVPEFTYLAARTMFSNRAKGVGATKMVRNKNKSKHGLFLKISLKRVKNKKYKQSNQWSQRRKIMQASRQHIIYVRLPNCENLYIIIVFVRSST